MHRNDDIYALYLPSNLFNNLDFILPCIFIRLYAFLFSLTNFWSLAHLIHLFRRVSDLFFFSGDVWFV